MENANLLPENEYRTVEGRNYINPNLPIEETNTFIENLRDTQRGNLSEITEQTEALGTAVPSNLGGLTGGEGYWTSRYVTPQTNSAVSDLRATAQGAALNEALANEKAMWDKRYQDAYRAYQKRQNDKTNTPTTTTNGEVEAEDNTYTVEGATTGAPGGYTVANIDTETGEVTGYTYVPYGQDGQVNYQAPVTPTYTKVSPTNVNIRENKIGYRMPNGQVVWATSGSQYIALGSDGKYYAVDSKTGQGHYLGG